MSAKDRSGVLTAVLLGTLDIVDEDVIADYILSAQPMKDIMNRLFNDPETPEDVKNLPDYTWEASAESMELFLSTLQREYGSAREFIMKRGADRSLFGRLENALLV